MRPIVTDVLWSVYLSVCVADITESRAKAAELTAMGVWTFEWTKGTMYYVEDPDSLRRRGNFRGAPLRCCLSSKFYSHLLLFMLSLLPTMLSHVTIQTGARAVTMAAVTSRPRQ